jgi:hypothetical protein
VTAVNGTRAHPYTVLFSSVIVHVLAQVGSVMSREKLTEAEGCASGRENVGREGQNRVMAVLSFRRTDGRQQDAAKGM